MTDIKLGDRVRTVIEGDWRGSPLTYGKTYGEPRDFEVESGPGDTITFEKIEPPVETFGPGDVVKNKYSGTIHHIGYGGCLSYGNWMIDTEHKSDDYVRIELVEKPF